MHSYHSVNSVKCEPRQIHLFNLCWDHSWSCFHFSKGVLGGCSSNFQFTSGTIGLRGVGDREEPGHGVTLLCHCQLSLTKRLKADRGIPTLLLLPDDFASSCSLVIGHLEVIRNDGGLPGLPLKFAIQAWWSSFINGWLQGGRVLRNSALRSSTSVLTSRGVLMSTIWVGKWAAVFLSRSSKVLS